jgi:tetratricopeptide (TPR) repeat protein
MCDAVFPIGAVSPQGEIEDYSGPAYLHALGSPAFMTQSQYYYENGMRLAQGGHFSDARREFEKSLASEPNPESEIQIGLIELNTNSPDKALLKFQRAIRLNPGIPEAHEFLGEALMLQKDYKNAERSLREAILLYGDNPAMLCYRANSHYNLGETLMKLNRRVEAKKEFLEVRRLSPNYPCNPPPILPTPPRKTNGSKEKTKGSPISKAPVKEQ